MRARQQHLKNLSEIFDLDLEFLKRRYGSLVQMETRGHKLAEDYCNGDIDSDMWDKHLDLFSKAIQEFFKDAKNRKAVQNIRFNGDPRGYFLKLEDSFVRDNKIIIETDWGGYGILCPKGV